MQINKCVCVGGETTSFMGMSVHCLCLIPTVDEIQNREVNLDVGE